MLDSSKLGREFERIGQATKGRFPSRLVMKTLVALLWVAEGEAPR